MAEQVKSWSVELLKALLIAAITVYANMEVLKAELKGVQKQANANTEGVDKNRDMIIDLIKQGASR